MRGKLTFVERKAGYMAIQTVITCKLCGTQHDCNRWDSATKDRLLRSKMCFTCDFWSECAGKSDYQSSVRIDGKCYWIGVDELQECDGREYTIAFHDGRQVVTTNLSYQGDIPALWKARLPDNAEFVSITEMEERKPILQEKLKDLRDRHKSVCQSLDFTDPEDLTKVLFCINEKHRLETQIAVLNYRIRSGI